MKISEIKERKIIHRPTLDFDEDGKRIYHAYEYYLPYNPGYKGNEREQLFAKVIDMTPSFMVFLLVFHKHWIISFLYSIPYVIIIGTFSEFLWGTTLGKKIFKIKVIDDHGNFPSFFKSLQRNLLCLINLRPVFRDYTPPPNSVMGIETTTMNFSMNLNNKICKTYIVKESKLEEIRSLLDTEQPKNNERLID